MWNSMKSVRLSSICTRIVMVGVVACAIFLPRMMGIYRGYAIWATEGYINTFMALLYACCIPAMLALFCLDRLLANIKRGQVFIPQNVTYLRRISWCCFAVALMLLAAGRYYLLFLAAAIAAGFMGLILRVVKNVIEEAVNIKTENDYTI